MKTKLMQHRLRAERLRAFPSGSRGDFCLRSDDTPGKTVAIAERSALSTDFPYGDVSREVYWKIIRATSWHKEPEVRPVSDVK